MRATVRTPSISFEYGTLSPITRRVIIAATNVQGKRAGARGEVRPFMNTRAENSVDKISGRTISN